MKKKGNLNDSKLNNGLSSSLGPVVHEQCYKVDEVCYKGHGNSLKSDRERDDVHRRLTNSPLPIA